MNLISKNHHSCKKRKYAFMQGRSQEFLFGGPSYNSNIFIKITPHTHIHTLFYYIHTYLFDKLYIYTHQTTTKKSQ